jgi:hypothetical protein
MAPIFFVLSSPVRLPDGTFGVVSGTPEGLTLTQFRTRWRAKLDHVMQLAMLRTAVDMPLDTVSVDGAGDYQTVIRSVELEYGLRGLPLPAWEVDASSATTIPVAGLAASVITPGAMPHAAAS